jgi:hypothetical protein
MVAWDGKLIDYAQDGMTKDYNVLYGGSGAQTGGRHDVLADPKFVSPSSVSAEGALRDLV